LVKSGHFYVLNTGKYRQIFAGIGIWSPEYRYSSIGIYRIGNTNPGMPLSHSPVLGNAAFRRKMAPQGFVIFYQKDGQKLHFSKFKNVSFCQKQIF
jgi:hypothetical protein